MVKKVFLKYKEELIAEAAENFKKLLRSDPRIRTMEDIDFYLEKDERYLRLPKDVLRETAKDWFSEYEKSKAQRRIQEERDSSDSDEDLISAA